MCPHLALVIMQPFMVEESLPGLRFDTGNMRPKVASCQNNICPELTLVVNAIHT